MFVVETRGDDPGCRKTLVAIIAADPAKEFKETVEAPAQKLG